LTAVIRKTSLHALRGKIFFEKMWAEKRVAGSLYFNQEDDI